jgi:serine protease Do
MTPELAKSFNLEPDKGVLVAQVDGNSPASRAGLQSGDVILEYNGKQVHSAQDLSLAVAETKVGAPAAVQVLRNGRPLSLEVRVGERPADVAENLRSPQDSEHGKLGITVENLTPEAARELRLSSSKGVLVTEVRPGSPADDGGVQTGDVIHEINHMPVNNASDLLAVIRNLKIGSNVLLRVERQGQTMFLAFQLS